MWRPTITVTHLDKVYWPKDGYTRGHDRLLPRRRELLPYRKTARSPCTASGWDRREQLHQKDVERRRRGRPSCRSNRIEGRVHSFLVCQDEAIWSTSPTWARSKSTCGAT
jgi:hypothetical protein